FYFFFQAEDGIRDFHVTGVQTCALPICHRRLRRGLLCARRTHPAEHRAAVEQHHACTHAVRRTAALDHALLVLDDLAEVAFTGRRPRRHPAVADRCAQAGQERTPALAHLRGSHAAVVQRLAVLWAVLACEPEGIGERKGVRGRLRDGGRSADGEQRSERDRRPDRTQHCGAMRSHSGRPPAARTLSTRRMGASCVSVWWPPTSTTSPGSTMSVSGFSRISTSSLFSRPVVT